MTLENNQQAPTPEKNINSDQVKKLIKTIEEKMVEAINNSDLGEFFARQGLVENTVKMEMLLDLNQIRNNDFIKDPELKESLQQIPDEELTVFYCCWNNGWVRCVDE
jgi:hypothetical protein